MYEKFELKKYIGKGTTGKCYELKDGTIFKEFNSPQSIDEIDRYKYFLNYANNSFLFPYEFIYDSKKFYGYISKKAFGKTLNEIFPSSNLLNLSTNSLKLERDIEQISKGNIIMYDLHNENIIYDGRDLKVIDVDDYSKNFADSNENVLINFELYRKSITNLFIANLNHDKHKYKLWTKINKYNYLNIKPSEFIVEIKNTLDKYYKEDIKTMEDIKKIR